MGDDTAAAVGTRLDAAVPAILRWFDVEPTPVRVADASELLMIRMGRAVRRCCPA